jgi:hypothetical protein
MSHAPAIEEIKHLKGAYFHAIDAKLWDVFSQLFTADCTFLTYRDVANLQPKRRCGPEEIVASVRRAVGDAVTAHQGHLLEIEIQSPENATAVWAMTDYAEIPNGTAPPKILRGAGRYYEDYRLVDGKWRIARIELKRSALAIE